MKVLLIGSGARESAFAWKLKQSSYLDQLFIAPGNAGTSDFGKNIDLDINDMNILSDFIRTEHVGMVVVGPEKPLVDGLYDKLRKLFPQLMIIGPSQKGALLEGSKSFAKDFMQKYKIPTAKHVVFTKHNLKEAEEYIDNLQKMPVVLKADGLAAGKGVLIIDDKSMAKEEMNKIFDGKFGSAGEKIVIEEFLDGIEFSVFVITNGKQYKILPIAKDYKRIGNRNTGKNTGGMGAISPVPFITDELMINTILKVVEPTINGIWRENIEYYGFVYFGLINVNNEPFVIEYNCRMGDPETQVVFPRLQDDLIELFVSLYTGKLDDHQIAQTDNIAVTVVIASGGYPDEFQCGYVIENIGLDHESIIFHASTKKDGDAVITDGGRVLSVTSLSNSKEDALKKCLNTIGKINFKDKYFRTDIGFDI